MTVFHSLIAAALLLSANVASMAQDAAPPVPPTATAATPDAAPPDQERLAAARDLMTVMGVDQQMDTMLESIKQSFLQGAGDVPTDKKANFERGYDAVIKKFADYRADMLNDFAALYSQHFTAAEMKAVADFYRSGPGAKFIGAMPTLMQSGQVIGLKYSKKVMEDMKSENNWPPQ